MFTEILTVSPCVTVVFTKLTEETLITGPVTSSVSTTMISSFVGVVVTAELSTVRLVSPCSRLLSATPTVAYGSSSTVSSSVEIMIGSSGTKALPVCSIVSMVPVFSVSAAETF
ncbi:hypothetical protein SDC9_126499 [bioreactor metagenome]|uniref:Uncharacterized protein n=1 Tax=bioreactor metagenome TaxID=1076179 RepID=A0A645CRD6_9ZZZZ